MKSGECVLVLHELSRLTPYTTEATNGTVTLNVSLKVPDGIVLASDSLLTVSQPVDQKMNVNCKCPKCNENIEIQNVQIPLFSIPSSTFPYSQKLFSIRGRFGLTIFGAGFVNGRSIYSHVTEVNVKIAQLADNDDLLDNARDVILTYFNDQLSAECQKTGFSIALQPDTWWPFGFQLAGFAKDATGEHVAKVYHIQIGKKSAWQLPSNIALCTGDGTVINLLWPKGQMGANVGAFSLQDAIDYVRFLIRTTTDYQRFSGKLPSVGGEIDIALITHRLGFRWIAQKELYRMLDRAGTGG